jgi:hypothetical protein
MMQPTPAFQRAPTVGDLVRARPGSGLEADFATYGSYRLASAATPWPALIIDTRGIEVLLVIADNSFWVRRDQLEIL